MRNTMKLGESINTYDPAEALHNEVGTFRVKVPAGAELLLICKPGGVTGLKWGYPRTRQEPFFITKITEPANLEAGALPITEVA